MLTPGPLQSQNTCFLFSVTLEALVLNRDGLFILGSACLMQDGLQIAAL
jgi:hypothetical protein